MRLVALFLICNEIFFFFKICMISIYLFIFIMLQVSNSYFLDFYMRFFNKKIYTHMGVTWKENKGKVD